MIDGKLLIAARKKKGKTQSDLGVVLNIDQSAYSRKEKAGDFTDAEADKICKFLGIKKEQIESDNLTVNQLNFLTNKIIQTESALKVVLSTQAEILAKLTNGNATKIRVDLESVVDSLALYVFSSHKKGISSHQLAKDISVTQKSAWFLLHRLRYAFDHPNFKAAVGNTVEIDECGIGGESYNKHSNKKVKNEEGNTISTKACVIGMRERGGNVIAKVVFDRTKESLLPVVYENLKHDAVVMTDEYSAYTDLKKYFRHYSVNHTAKEFVNGMAHTNGIENFWSHLKRGIDGIYHQISKEHLQAYVNEFLLRFNTRKFQTQSRFDLILSGVSGKRLTYEQLIK